MKLRGNMRGGGGRALRRGGRPPGPYFGGGMSNPGPGPFGFGGGPPGGGGGPPPPPRGQGKIPFDLHFCEDIFPRVTPAPDDSPLTDALLRRNKELTPSTEELQAIQNMVTRVQSILENLILTPGTFDSCQLDEIRQVGSFKQGTILAGHKTADFVVILKTLPTKEAVEALCNKVGEIFKQTECVRESVTDRGFELSNVQQVTIRILISTVPQNFRKLDPELHLAPTFINQHWAAIRHSRWFEENAHNSTIKVLIRILRDMRVRFPPLLPLNTWMLDLFVHFCTVNNPTRAPLPVNVAFRRILALMAGGMFLPGYCGANGSFSGGRGYQNQHHNPLSYEEQDVITATAQTLLRILSHGGMDLVLGLDKTDILNTPTIFDRVVVLPSEKAYERNNGSGGVNEEENNELFESEEYIQEEDVTTEEENGEGEEMESQDKKDFPLDIKTEHI